MIQYVVSLMCGTELKLDTRITKLMIFYVSSRVFIVCARE